MCFQNYKKKHVNSDTFFNTKRNNKIYFNYWLTINSKATKYICSHKKLLKLECPTIESYYYF